MLTTLVRAAALAVTVLIILLTGGQKYPNDVFRTCVFVIAFPHYIMALLYSRNQVFGVIARPATRWRFSGLLLLGALAYFHELFPLVLYFGIHHAFNEAYLLGRVTKANDDVCVQALRPASSMLHFMVYLFLLRIHVPNIPIPLMVAGMTVCALFFGYRLWKARHVLSAAELVENSSAEILSLFVALISLHTMVKFLYIVGYHFVYWALRPIPKLFEAGAEPVLRYGAMTAFLFGLAFLASPLGIRAYPLSNSLFYSAFTFFSYLHITLSFALSDFHPRAVVNFFRPAVS